MTASPHVREQLDEWIDGRLSDTEESQVDRHLEECPSCREEAAALRAVRAAVASRGHDVELPAGLEDRIRGLLDAEDAIAREKAQEPGAALDHRRRSTRTSRRLAVWALPLAAVLLLAVVAILWTMQTRSIDEPIGAVFARFGELTGESETWREAQLDSARELEQLWRAAELGFPARVLDLSMSGYVLAGGQATRLGERPAALAIYEGPGGIVTCWMFDGSDRREEDFPEAVDVHEANDIRFHVFERGGVTLVVWREGEVLCVLSARMDRDAVVQLAHAKAMARPLV